MSIPNLCYCAEYSVQLTEAQWAYLLPAIPHRLGVRRLAPHHPDEFYAIGTRDDHHDIQQRLKGLSW